MKRSIFYFAALILALLIISCETPDLLEYQSDSAKYAAVEFSGSLPIKRDALAGRIPLCSDKTPSTLYVEMLDEGSLRRTTEVPIVMEGAEITQAGEFTAPIGNNIVVAMKLLSSEGDTLYSVPDKRFDGFSDYFFAQQVPFQFEVSEEGQNAIEADLACFREAEIQPFGNLSPGLAVQELQSLYFMIGSEDNCTALVTVAIDGFRISSVTTQGEGAYSTPVPKNYQSMRVSSYDTDGNQLLYFVFNAHSIYSPEHVLTQEDVMVFNNICD